MKSLTYSAIAAAGLVVASAGAQAQSSNKADAMTMAKQSSAVADTATLAEWEYNSIYNAGGIRAEYMVTEEVFGPEGEEIGNVENVIVNAQGQIAAIIAEVGGFWDIADTHIAVPWDEVTLIPDGFKIPVTEDNFDDYAFFGDNSFVTKETLQQAKQVDDSLTTGPQTWKLTALLDDYVTLENGAGYGYVNDVIFSKDGQITAVVVNPTVAAYGTGVYAYPFHGYEYGWHPGGNAYTLPYKPDQIGTLEPFQYGMFNGYWQ